MNWNRPHYMTVGILMIFCGFHFRIVESFVLTPEVTKFMDEQSDGLEIGGDTYTQNVAGGGYNNGSMFTPTYQQASTYGAPAWQNAGYGVPAAAGILSRKTLTPPTWLGWPVICVGSVLFLFGITSPPNQ